MNKISKIKFFTVSVALLSLCLVMAGCGRTGDPRPRQATRSFAWQEINVTPSGDCLDINALMSGVYSNLEAVMLEFADVSDEDCPGCPFMVKEQIPVRDLNQVFDAAKGELRFSHCPRIKAPAYRLRLVGINVYDASRHAVSPVKYIEMPVQRR